MSQLPSVSFYALKQTDPDSVIVFACRLAEKAHQLNHRVHLHTESEAQLSRLDELLWQFKADSFLPHANIDEGQPNAVSDYKITLGTGANMPSKPEVLINLANQVWDSHSNFNDIREIVSADDTGRDLGRQRYRYYQSQGYNIETLKM
jgi:DNA polymerase-3 subunit chi